MIIKREYIIKTLVLRKLRSTISFVVGRVNFLFLQNLTKSEIYENF